MTNVLVCCVILAIVASASSKCYEWNSLFVFNWNLLAPKWANDAMYPAGVIDRRLFNETNRLLMAKNAIIGANADVIMLQEVQNDWLEEIKLALGNTYDLAIYKEHEPIFQPSAFLRINIKQGLGNAIFFKPRRLTLLDTRDFLTTSSGNRVVFATFEMAQVNRPPITFVNSQLEKGILGIRTRLFQVNSIHQVTKMIKKDLEQRFSLEFEPQVVWGGDFNTLSDMQTYARMSNLGYSNVFDVLKLPTPNNYYGSLVFPHPISYVFVPTQSVQRKLIEIAYSFVNNEDERQPTEKEQDRLSAINFYVHNILAAAKVSSDSSNYEMLSEFLRKRLTYDHPLNAILRKGSDHASQIVSFCFP